MFHSPTIHHAARNPILGGLHMPDARSDRTGHTGVEFLYVVLLALIVATSLSGFIAAYLALSALQ